MTRRVIIAMSGASGAPYAHRLLSWWASSDGPKDVEPHLVFSRAGRLVWEHEMGTDPSSFGFPLYGPGELTAPCASGSARFDGMAVVPCSAACLARIAHGTTGDLLGRTADVMLKERRPLLLVLRESPYSLIQIRNMAAVTEGGATVLPASPHFYNAPDGVTGLLDTVLQRVLDHLGVAAELSPRWEGRT